MVPWANLGAFALASAVLVAIPGPSVLFVIGRSLALGRSGGLLSVLGNALGLIPPVLAVTLGVGGLLARSVAVFTVLKLAGAVYLIFLGITTIRHGRELASVRSETPTSRGRLIGQGMIVGVTNPKTTVFLVAMLPQFVAYDRGSVWLQLLVLGSVYVLVALCGDACWALAAGSARDWFAGSASRMVALRRTGGALMIGLGGILAVSAHKS